MASTAAEQGHRPQGADAAPAQRVRRLLPRGNTLPYDAWLTRHRWLVWILAAQGVGIFGFALARGYSLEHSLLEGGLLVAIAAAAWAARAHRRFAGVVCSVGLVTTSAVLVHVSGGLIEAHFHFFVMIILLTLYEDWLSFLVAAGYVAAHHGLAGLIDPNSVYNHPDAIANPVKWALIHALFVAAAGAAAVVTWRLNEDHRRRSEDAYRRAHSSERSLLEAHALAGLGGFEVDVETGEPSWSPELYRIFGIDPSTQGQVLADAFMNRVDPDDREPLQQAFAEAVREESEFSTQFRYQHPDDGIRHIASRGELVKDADGRAVRLAGASQDVTERERGREIAVQRAEAQRAIAELGERALAGPDLHELFADAAAMIIEVLGVEIAAVSEWLEADDEFVVVAERGMGGTVGERYPAGDRSQSGMTLVLEEPVVVDDWDMETRFPRPAIVDRAKMKSGVTTVIRRREGRFGVLGVASLDRHGFDPEDVSIVQAVANVLSAAIDRVDSEEQMRHRALHDPLTGLPNRVLFGDRLAQALGHAVRERERVAVLFCDLDQFKIVNDSLGHEAGDELLQAVAPRLSSLLRPGDTVARFGGDEFAILVAERLTVREITRVAERVAAALSRPFVICDRELFVTASIGIAVGDGGESPESMIRDADLAMYRAKERGRGRYELFDTLMRARAVDHLRTENELRRAIDRDELRVVYQPVVELASGEIAGFEALVRWQHPQRGLVGPSEFIPLAEESDLIVALGDRVLEQACVQAAEWQCHVRDSEPFQVSVNISARQLADSGFPDRVGGVLARTGLDPAHLSLEVTETMLIDEVENPTAGFARLQGLGVGVVLDDFGTGFSSLSYLKRFPFDLVKIDRTFVDRVVSESVNAAIVTAVAGIAEALGLGVVAEGVETPAQRDAVARLGCRYGQGYLFARPLAPAEATKLVLERGRATGAANHLPARPTRRSRDTAGKQQLA